VSVFESRQKVDELVRKAVAAGGKTYQEPRITALCTDMDFRIWLATSGSWSTWSGAQCNPQAQLESTHEESS